MKLNSAQNVQCCKTIKEGKLSLNAVKADYEVSTAYKAVFTQYNKLILQEYSQEVGRYHQLLQRAKHHMSNQERKCQGDFPKLQRCSIIRIY